MKTKRQELFQKPVMILIMALICCTLWGSAFPCVKIGYALFQIEDTGSQILFAGYRFFLAGILTFIIGSIIDKKPALPKKTSLPALFGQGMIQTTAQYVCFYVGLAHLTGSKGSVINSSGAFFTIILAHFLLKNEKITWNKGLGCIIGFAGVVLVNVSPGSWTSGFSFLGEGMILLSAVSNGFSAVTSKPLSYKESPVCLTAFQLFFGGAVLIIIGLLSGGQVRHFTPTSTALLIYMALLSTVAFTLWTTLIKYNSVGKIAIFNFGIPIFGVLLSGIFLHESFLSAKNLLALALVVIGIILVNIVQERKE